MISPRPACDDEAPLQVNSAIYRVCGGKLLEPTLSRPADELVLLVEVTTGSSRSLLSRDATLSVELYRGEQLRDRFEQALGPGDRGRWSFAFRLCRGPSSSTSSRLVARVLLDGAEVAGSAVLLGRPDVDAQGRFAEGVSRTASTQTLLGYEGAFLKLLDPRNHTVEAAARDRPEKDGPSPRKE
jgi:hypothetical protein